MGENIMMDINKMAELMKAMADVTCGTGEDRIENMGKVVKEMEEKMPKDVVDFNHDISELMGEFTSNVVKLCVKHDKDCKDTMESVAIALTAAAKDDSYLAVMELEKLSILLGKALEDKE
jgi:hypothetical protein